MERFNRYRSAALGVVLLLLSLTVSARGSSRENTDDFFALLDVLGYALWHLLLGLGFVAYHAIVPLIQLTWSHPLVAFPVWTVGLLWVQRNRRHTRALMIGGLHRMGWGQRKADGLADGLAAASLASQKIKREDPLFDEAAFLARTRRIFLEIVTARFHQKLDPVRCCMSDGVYRRYATLLRILALEGEREAISDAAVLDTRIEETLRTEVYDCITVRIRAWARDLDVPATMSERDAIAETMKLSLAAGFTEYWTFVRYRDAKGPATEGGVQGNCPNCGAPFSGGATNSCQFCHAIVNSGHFDWVLVEVCEDDYVPNWQHPIFGMEALRAKDPDAVNVLIEDRALLIWWKWMEARVTADMKPIRQLTSGRGLASVEQEIQGTSGLKVLGPSASRVSIDGIQASQNGVDRAYVTVSWSEKQLRDPSEQKNVTGLDGPQYTRVSHSTCMVLARDAHAHTNKGAGLSTDRCPQCGAPMMDSDSSACGYCGHDFSASTADWQLDMGPQSTSPKHWPVPVSPKSSPKAQPESEQTMAPPESDGPSVFPLPTVARWSFPWRTAVVMAALLCATLASKAFIGSPTTAAVEASREP